MGYRILKPRRNKYNAVRSCGYDSVLEKQYAARLELFKLKGIIQDCLHHPPAVVLIEKGKDKITWRVDFLVTSKSGVDYYVETKGLENQAYRMQKKLWRIFLSIPLIIIKRKGRDGFVAVESIGVDTDSDIIS